jgi:pimeloyl-ACP methyl ester carboxylesterase
MACAWSAALGASGAAADSRSLFSGPGQRPGPKLLYERPTRAPQLTNTGIWRAKPILISGASAYRRGEFLHQDFLYDDHGAQLTHDPNDPHGAGSLFSSPNGTHTYPTAAAYAGNAADLVELRVKPRSDATAFRLTFNTLTDPRLTAATIAIGDSSTPRAMPFGANTSAPAQFFVTWHGSTAELTDAATGSRVDTTVGVAVDGKRRQVQLTVPHSAWDPGRSTVRLAAAVGLWDQANNGYLLPAASSTADRPGGAGSASSPSAFFNVAFRSAEPFQGVSDTSALNDPAWWRDRLQGEALASGDISRFSAQVDFDQLARGVNDNLRGQPGGVPSTGTMNRILSSRFETGSGGADFRDTCPNADNGCRGELRGRLQPYTVYVPAAKPSGGRYQLTLLLHSLTANYNQFSATRNQTQFGDRQPPSIVITPEGRGPDGSYRDIAGADTFEVWADIASRYRLDPRLTTVAGYSMGGFGTFKFASQYPDLFARAQPTVGAGAPQTLPSVRWVPFLMWNAREDELVPPRLFEPSIDRLQQLGYRAELDDFEPLPFALPVPTANHLLLAINNEFGPAAAFLDAARVVRNPPRVTYVYTPGLDFPKAGTTADHAYWVTRIKARDKSTFATIDVRSRGFGLGDPKPTSTSGTSALQGGLFPPRPYSFRRTTWGPTPRIKKRNRLTITATNVSSVKIDAKRARVTCDAKLKINSDGPLQVRLRNCP